MPEWKQAAEDWHNQDLNFANKPITYNQLLLKIHMHQCVWTDYTLNKKDMLWYPKRKRA